MNEIKKLNVNGTEYSLNVDVVEGYLSSGNFYKTELVAADYVEIGGLKWATKNIGASSATDAGLYFQWGDTQGYTASQVGSGSGQKAFTWDDYKYGDGSTFTKYNSTDGKTVLDASDDAVTVAWEGNWRMPTTAEFQAFGTETTSAWTADYEGSGVAGLVLTSKADSSKKLFFPAVGNCGDGNVNDVGSYGYYWSSSFSSDGVSYAYRLNFSSGHVSWRNDNNRYYGFAVRGVWDGEGTPVISQTVQVTPEQNKLYIDTTTNKIYRHDGSSYVEVSSAPTSLPASDVYSWAKSSTKPSYTLDEIPDGSNRKLSDFADRVTKSELNEALSDISDDWYGIQWTSANTTPIRIGNMSMHKSLPIQKGMKRCLLQDNGSTYGYISQQDHTKYDDGRSVDYTGTHGQVMVEIPEYHYDALKYTENNVTTYVLKLYPYSNKGKLSKKVYVSAFEATSDDANPNASTKKLYSICTSNIIVNSGSVNANDVSYTADATLYRGGNARTISTDDNAQNSLLGRPVTNLTRDAFRTRANNRGEGWSQQYWSAYMSIVRLYVVEYCNFNAQSTYYNTVDSNGYKRGGLGDGLSNVSNWNGFNSYNPITPCGITLSLVNETGVISYTASANSVSINTNVPSYRGIENPWGHIWKWTDGINIYGDSENNKSLIYTCDDITKFADNTSTNYVLRIDNAAYGTDGFIKTCNWDENGDFIPISQGGSSSSYFYDYSWFQNAEWKVLASGGGAYYGSVCGWFCFIASFVSSYSRADIGGRLYYTPTE